MLIKHVSSTEATLKTIRWQTGKVSIIRIN